MLKNLIDIKICLTFNKIRQPCWPPIQDYDNIVNLRNIEFIAEVFFSTTVYENENKNHFNDHNPIACSSLLLSLLLILVYIAGVGNDFFPGGVQWGGFGPRAQGGIRGGGFSDPKIDRFWSKFKF